MHDLLRREAETVHPHALPDVSKRMYAAFTAGLISEVELEIVGNIIAVRQTPSGQARTAAVALGRCSSIFPKRRLQRAPERSVAIERRRRLAFSGPMPPQLAARFTTGQVAVLKIVADEIRDRGLCALCVDAIAARAGVCRRLAQDAIRLAEGDGLLLIEERRRHGNRNLPNVLRCLSREWLAWIKRGRGGGCKTLYPTDSRDQNLAAVKHGEGSKGAFGWEDGGPGQTIGRC